MDTETSNADPTPWDMALAFSIWMALWIVSALVFNLIFPSWHQSLLRHAVSGLIPALLWVFILPPPTDLWNKLRHRFHSS